MNLKILGKNTVIYAIGNVGLRAASFLLIPIYTHFMSVNEFGMFATLLLSIQIMVIFMDAGMQTSIVRFFHDFKSNLKTGQLVGTTLILMFISASLVISGSMFFLQKFFQNILHTDQVRHYIFLVGLAALVQSVNQQFLAYHRAQNQAKIYTLTGISVAAFLVFYNFLFLYYLKMGVAGGLVAYISAHITVNIYIGIRIFRKEEAEFSWPVLRKLVKFGAPIVLSMSAWFVRCNSAPFFLSYYSGLEATAIFSLGLKFAMISSILLLLPFQLAFEPVVYASAQEMQIKDKVSRLFTYLLTGFTFAAFFIIAGTKVILPFAAPPEYGAAFTIVLFLVPIMIFEAMHEYGKTLLQVSQKTHVLGIAALFFSLLNIVLNIFLIRHFGIWGAVAAFGLVYVSTGITILLLGLKAFPLQLENGRLYVIAIILIILVVALAGIKEFSLLAFIGINMVIVFSIIIMFYATGFFRHDEKLLIRRLFNSMLIKIAR